MGQLHIGKYLNPDIVVKYPYRLPFTIQVDVYTNGTYHICPSPLDDETVSCVRTGVKAEYLAYIGTYYVPYRIFFRKSSWNL